MSKRPAKPASVGKRDAAEENAVLGTTAGAARFPTGAIRPPAWEENFALLLREKSHSVDLANRRSS
jgi:hypothetical protein